MADNIAVTEGAGKTVATDDVSAIQHQLVKLEYGTDGAATMVSDTNPLPVKGDFVLCTTTVTRPNDVIAYATNDVLADSTTVPTAGGFTLTSAGRASAGSGVITDAVIINSAPAALTGEIWIFDSAVTAVNDNAAFALSDADALLLIGIIPFTTEAQPSNAVAHCQGLSIGFTCVGTANLRFLIKVKAAYTPVALETVTVRLKIVQAD